MALATVFEISRKDLLELDIPESASITDVKHLSSYNWLEAPQSTPTIAVPGSPALWTPPRVPRPLKKDSGFTYIAQNAARHPESPLEPLFRALYSTHPSFDIHQIDVVTERNSIRKLLSFVDSSSKRNGHEEFTINIEVTQNTALFCRHEAKTQDFIGSNDFRGYGREFEKTYTVNQICGSTGHHRIISYRFSDLNFIVCHETDGYSYTEKRLPSSEAREPAQNGYSSMRGTFPLTLGGSDSDTVSRMITKEEGTGVPLESTLEIKTRVAHKPLEIHEIAPQLWISQTPKLVRAYHQRGMFYTPVVEDVTATIKEWEAQKQNDLRKLSGLIKKIITLVKECGGHAILRHTADGDKLVLSRVERKHMLPKDLYLNWDVPHNPGNNIDEHLEIALTGQMSISTLTTTADDPKAAITA